MSKASRPAAVVAVVGLLLGLAAWWRLPTPPFDPPAGSDAAGAGPDAAQRPSETTPDAPTDPSAPTPPARPARIPSRTSRVDFATFQTYIDRYALPRPSGWDALPKHVKQERAWQSAQAPSMRNLAQLRAATATYRTYLLHYQGAPPEVERLFEHELVISAMLTGEPIPFDTLKDRACQLATVPRRCHDDQPPGCLAADGLLDMARGICEDPRAEVPEYGGKDFDHALHPR